MALMDWVKLPTAWIDSKELVGLRWTPEQGADNVAALMLLIVLAHRADRDSGAAHLTYDQFCDATALSRAKVSSGLKVLEAMGLMQRKPSGRSSFHLANYDPQGGWGKLPAKRLYARGSNQVSFFSELSLRKPVELHALKLYLLFVARRDNSTNLANISYDKIEDYTGIERGRIKSGLSLLAANSLVHVERLPTMGGIDYAVSNAYRLVQLETHTHMGTVGRRLDQHALQEFAS